ncbi:Os03g0344650, partial [Oryza sativa Japonica Group]
EGAVYVGLHQQRQHVVAERHAARRRLPPHLRHRRARRPVHDPRRARRLPQPPLHPVPLHGPPVVAPELAPGAPAAAPRLARRLEPRPLLAAGAAAAARAVAVPPPDQVPQPRLAEDLDDDVAGEVHEADVGGAAGAVVVDAVDDAAAGVVHGAPAAVEHQRLHPDGEHLPLL